MSDAQATLTRRASAPRVSAWVSAHAGSGKTYVLVRRILRLLLAGTGPDRILCLTFTRAAAAEMANRLFAELGDWAALSDEVLRPQLEAIEGREVSPGEMLVARRLFARAIETPGGLKVQTIHAFCERLLQQFPFEANVPAHFQVMDDGVAAELRQRALAACVAAAGSAPDSAIGRALDDLVGFAGDSRFQDLADALLRQRSAFRAWMPAGGALDPALQALRARLGIAPDDTATLATDAILADSGLSPGMWPELIALLRSSGKTDDGNCARALQAALEAGEGRRGAAYLEVWQTAAGTVRKTVMSKGLREANPAMAALIDAEKERIEALCARLRAHEVYDATCALLRLGDGILARYAALKQERGLLDYDDLIASAVDLLTRRAAAPWVLYKLDGGIDHILVDEAQDTSPEQWQVVRALAEEALAGAGARPAERTIFAVGDEKQSIYSFQGADPGAFARMQRFFRLKVEGAGRGWDSVPLQLSFRSVRAVLRAVDTVFDRPQARAGLQELDGPVRHEANRAGDPGLVEIWPVEIKTEGDDPDLWEAVLDNQAGDSPRERLAQRIARAIERLCAGEAIVERGRARPIRPGDILILVRRRNDFVDRMIAALTQRGIAVAGADRLKLGEHIAVQDLLAAADFCLLPEDDLTLAALLKSPLIGLDEDALFELAHQRPGSLWERLGARTSDARFQAAHERLAGWLARADYERPYGFFAHILGTEGGRGRLFARLGAEAADAIDELLNLALAYEQVEVPSLQGFTHWFRSQRIEVKRDMEEGDREDGGGEGGGEVRILTVHGAKGLEAPVVFLPDTCDVPGRGYAGPLVTLPPEAGAAGAPAPLVWAYGGRDTAPPAVRDALDAAHAAQLDEYRRLLYVAMTRARDRLYVCGALTRGKAPAPGSWYMLIREALEPLCDAVNDAVAGGMALRFTDGAMPAAASPAQAQAAAAASVVPAWALTPAGAAQAPLMLAPSRIAQAGGARARTPSGTGRDEALRRGNLIHRLLEHLPDLAPERRADAGGRMLALLAPELAAEERGTILADALALFAHPALAALFAPGAMAEVPVEGLLWRRAGDGREVRIAGQIDRLAVAGGRVLLADFKSNREVPATPGAIPPPYVAQLAAYREALRGLYPDKAIDALLVWTSGPVVMTVPDAMLDEALAALRDAHRAGPLPASS